MKPDRGQSSGQFTARARSLAFLTPGLSLNSELVLQPRTSGPKPMSGPLRGIFLLYRTGKPTDKEVGDGRTWMA